MPLPDNGAVWPPPELDAITPKLTEWGAWYSGDTSALANAYGDTSQAAWVRNRPSQYRGGVVGTLSRFFWGQPTDPGQMPTKLHIPLAADIATASADLLFSEEPKLIFDTGQGEESAPNTDRLDVILDGNNWSSLLPEAGELAAALGGVFLRVTYDTAVADHPLITTQHADDAIPEFRYGRLVAVTFWEVLSSEHQTYLRHLERHEPGRVEHALYEGTASNLGQRIPLTEHPATANITVDAESGWATGYDRLTAVYVPNILPQRIWRQHPLGRNLGRADVSGQEPMMDALDETWSSWMRDLRLGKARALVPQYMLENNGPGMGVSVNLDREVFTGLNIPPSEDGAAGITLQQFAIRTAEHQATATELIDQILRGAGYSPDTFGMGDAAAMTATEVDSRGRKSNLTREKKTRYWDSAIAELIEAVTAADRQLFGQGQRIRPTVEFAASVQPSQRELAETAQLLRTAQAASTDTLVRLTHPDWDDEQVSKEVAAILDETGTSVPDMGLTSQPFDQADPAVPPVPDDTVPGLPGAPQT